MKNVSNIFMYSLGGVIVVGFFILMVYLVKHEIPASNKDMLNLVVGALIGSFSTVVGYFYGSSKGSKDKTEILAKNNGNNEHKTS